MLPAKYVAHNFNFKKYFKERTCCLNVPLTTSVFHVYTLIVLQSAGSIWHLL